MYTISVFGLGFVGLTTALAFADKNQRVFGYDIDEGRLGTISDGLLPFMEPGLGEALERNLNKSFFTAKDALSAVRESDFVFLCVGTPCGEKGEADLQYLRSAIDKFATVLDDGKYRVIVVKSTVPPSTTSEKIIPYLQSKGYYPGRQFGVANNPEFLREGKCWEDMINADRIVCGVADEESETMLRLLYKNFNAPFFAVSHNTGEFIKYLSNTLLATMISFSNEMSKAADAIGDISVRDAFKILHLDRRWAGCEMKSYVYPGCGFGGYCLPKDTQAMTAKAISKGFKPEILQNVIKTNESMPGFMAKKIMAAANQGEKIGILGLSFKPGSDDVRDSSSAKIIKALQAGGYKRIYAFDPVANEAFAREYNFSQVVYCDSLQNLCESADILVITTAWPEFAGVNKLYPQKPIVDCRYFLER